MGLEVDLKAALLAAGLPVTNVYAPSAADRSTWQVGLADGATDAQRATLASTLSAFVVPRIASGDALIAALTDAQAALVKQRDLLRIAGRDALPEGGPLVARAAAKAGTTPAAWFDAALAPG